MCWNPIRNKKLCHRCANLDGFFDHRGKLDLGGKPSLRKDRCHRCGGPIFGMFVH